MGIISPGRLGIGLCRTHVNFISTVSLIGWNRKKQLFVFGFSRVFCYLCIWFSAFGKPRTRTFYCFGVWTLFTVSVLGKRIACPISAHTGRGVEYGAVCLFSVSP